MRIFAECETPVFGMYSVRRYSLIITRGGLFSLLEIFEHFLKGALENPSNSKGQRQ